MEKYKQAIQKLFDSGQKIGVSCSDLQDVLAERNNPQLFEALEIPVKATTDATMEQPPATPQAPAPC